MNRFRGVLQAAVIGAFLGLLVSLAAFGVIAIAYLGAIA